MKWLRCLTLLSMLTFSTACAVGTTVTGHVPSSYAPLPMEAFRALPTASYAASAVPVPSPVVSPEPTPRPTTKPKPQTTSGRRASLVIRGEASWGYGFKGHVVTRYKRGTIIRVCGPLGCTGKVRSWGYGPAKSTGRIADLDVHVFEDICGPRSIGVCDIKLEVWK